MVLGGNSLTVVYPDFQKKNEKGQKNAVVRGVICEKS